MTTNKIVHAGEVTACEELNRYCKKVNAYTKPIIDSIFPADKEVESQDAESDRPTNQMFTESVDESDNDWTDVTVPDQVPTENVNENFRLANGTGPIEMATGRLREKVAGAGSALLEKACSLPGLARRKIKKGAEVAVEEFSRVTFSESVSGVIQQYSLLEDLKASAARGKERARRGRKGSSPPPNPPPALHTERPLAKMSVGAEMADLEEVPILDEGEEDWHQFE